MIFVVTIWPSVPDVLLLLHGLQLMFTCQLCSGDYLSQYFTGSVFNIIWLCVVASNYVSNVIIGSVCVDYILSLICVSVYMNYSNV